MQLDAAATEYFYSKDLTAKSLEWYHYHLDLFFTWCRREHLEDTMQLTLSLLRRFFAEQREDISRYGRVRSAHNVHGTGRVVRNFLNFCEGEGWLVQTGMGKRLTLPKREQTVVDILSAQDIEALLRACKQKSPVLAARDTAIIAVLADTGVRANELLTLTHDRVHFSLSDAYIVVDGKGRKQREAALGKRARLALHRYTTSLRPQTTHPYVFLTRDYKPLQFEGLYHLLHRVGERAGLRQDLHAHLFRHSFAYHYLMQGGEVSRLSRILGHTSLAVTDLYIRSFTAHEARQGQVSLLDRLLKA